MADYTIRWVAALDATVATTYKIHSDEGTSGVFILESTANASDRGDGGYVPYQTTLNGAITASGVSLVLTSGTNFIDGDYITVDGETIKLGGKSVNTFAACERGIGGSVAIAHLTSAVVYKAHESAVVSIGSMGSRNIVRVRIIRADGGLDSVAAETAIIIPTPPPSNEVTTLYGIIRSAQGVPLANIAVEMQIESSGAYYPNIGEMIYKRTEATVTDADGYFEFFAPRDVRTIEDKGVTILIGTGDGQITWVASAIPNVDTVNFLET